MAHKFESVSVQIFIPSTFEGQDYELWSLHDYRTKDFRILGTDDKLSPHGDGDGLIDPDLVSDLILQVLVASGLRLADAEALEDADPEECDCSSDIKGVLCDECEKGENS